MRPPRFLRFVMYSCLLMICACSQQRQNEQIVQTFEVSSLEGVVARSGVELDKQISSDGNGSLRLVADQPTTFRLYEVTGVQVENALLTYRARIRTEDIQGHAFLEMWCIFPGQGEYFSRALHTPISGTTEWTLQQTQFSLEKGHIPSIIRLNVVVDGSGTVWVDEIALARSGR